MNLIKEVRKKCVNLIPGFNCEFYLNKLETNKSLRGSPKLFMFLLLYNNKFRNRFIIRIEDILGRISNRKDKNLVNYFRENKGLISLKEFRLNQNKVENIFKYYLNDEERAITFKLESIHSNNFFREKALMKFCKKRNPSIIPFIIIKYSDFMYKVKSKTGEIYCKVKKDTAALNNSYGLRVKNVVIDKLYKYGLYKNTQELEVKTLSDELLLKYKLFKEIKFDKYITFMRET